MLVDTRAAKSKVTARQFNKESSVFKQWLVEKPPKVKESVEIDCKMWKLPKFIKDGNTESEIEACKNVIMQNSLRLKEVFLHLASMSSFPAITMMGISNWVQKAGIVEGALTTGVVDRLFISANFQQQEN